MEDNLKDILSHLSANTDQETLLRYLQNKLTEDQKHEVEKSMIDDDFENDAMEGLDTIKNKEHISLLINQLNRDLNKKLDRKEEFRKKLRYKDQPWIYIAVIIVLLIAVIGYFIIHLLNKQQGH